MTNSFEFGRELSQSELVVRTDELATVAEAVGEGGGSSSSNRAASARPRSCVPRPRGGIGVVVLRDNAQECPSMPLLAHDFVEDVNQIQTSKASSRLVEL